MIRFLSTKRGGAIASHRSGAPSGLSRFASQAKPLLTIAGAFPELLAILACLAIWGGTFLAIWRLHHG